MGQDPTGDETSTLGLEEAPATHAFRIGMEIVKSWRPHAGSAGAFAKAWQSLFEALDELEEGQGEKIAQQLQKISDDHLKSYTKQEDENYERREKAREERAAARGPARRPSW